MSIHIWKWIKGWLPAGTFKLKIAPLAITILEGIKGVLDTKLFATIEQLVDPLTHHLSTEIIDSIKTEIPKAIAVFLGVEGLPANPTEQQVLDFEDKILAAIVSKTEAQKKGEIYTKLAAHIYITIENLIGQEKTSGKAITFAQIVIAIEDAYQSYLEYKAESEQP